MNESQKCNQCYRPFTVDHLPRRLPCGHNICQQCLEQILKSEFNVIFCQYCQKTIPRDGTQLPFNENLRLQIYQNKIKSLSPPKLAREEGETLLDDKPFHPTSPSLNQICPQHQVMMDIICTTDKKKICPHCALFGDHKKHSFKRIDDFEQELSDKCQLFSQIQSQKKNSKVNQKQQDVIKRIQRTISEKKQKLTQQVTKTVQDTFELILSLQKKAIKDIDTYFSELLESFKTSKTLENWVQSKNKFETWQKRCDTDINKLQSIEAIEDKINLYFNEPLQIVSEGYIYLEKLNKNYQSINTCINNITDVKINTKGLKTAVERAFKVIMPGTLIHQTQINQISNFVAEGDSQANPFLDCTSSEIGINAPSLIHNNVSIQDQICSLTTSVKVINDEAPSRIFSNKLMQSQKSPLKYSDKKQAVNQWRRATVCSPKPFNLKDTKTSEISAVRSAKRLTKTVLMKPVIQPDLKNCDLKQSDRRLADFMKSTLTDFLDLSDCHLSSQKVVEYVSKARKHHKIKGLKLCENYLDCGGFQKMIDNLKGVTNINLANNQLTESIFQIILKNKDRLDMLRVLNLSHNPISYEKKARNRLQDLKKTGIIINV